jgi:hypothetical protein
LLYASHHIAPSLDNAEFWAGMQALVQQAMRLEIAPLAEKLHHINEASARQAVATLALQEEVYAFMRHQHNKQQLLAHFRTH